MITSEFEIDVTGNRLTCLLAEPQRDSLSADPALLLTFSSVRREAIEKPPYNAAARRFVERGHRALSFDLPSHGDRAARDQGPELAAMCDSLLKGIDPFAAFVRDGMTVIDSCIARQIARPGRILLYGVSRGG